MTETTEKTGDAEAQTANGEANGAAAPAAETESAVRTPKTIAERVNGALAKGRQNPKMTDFVAWTNDENVEIDLDLDTVIATLTLYNDYRKTDRYSDIKKTVDAEKASAVKVVKAPSTPEEAEAQIKKLQQDAERAAAAQARREEALKRAQEFLASAQNKSEDTSDEDVPDEDAEADDTSEEEPF